MRVLLVDDEVTLRRMIARVLRDDMGHAVTEVGDVDEATHKLMTGGYDVLITDVTLPGLDGCTLAQNVRRAIPTMRVLLLSGFTMDDLLAMRPECRGLALLQKPFTPGDLRLTLVGMGVDEVWPRPA